MYDPTKTYSHNYLNPPKPVECDSLSDYPNQGYAGLPVQAPFALAAGPGLNSKWLLYYASLGFDILTYKTVRVHSKSCNSMPNVVPIQNSFQDGAALETAEKAESWAVSFGMPTLPHRFWRADVALARAALPDHKVLSVSVVGKDPQEFARCAGWAVRAGADAIEANMSCPNDKNLGALYLDPTKTRESAVAIRDAIGDVPLLIKIGPMPDRKDAELLVEAMDGLNVYFVTTNCMPAPVLGLSGPLFGGDKRGVGGEILRELSLSQTKVLTDLGASVIGVGGISATEDALAYFEAGAGAVQIASAVLTNPKVCLDLRNGVLSGSTN